MSQSQAPSSQGSSGHMSQDSTHSIRRPGESRELSAGPKAVVAYDHGRNGAFVPQCSLTVVYDDDPEPRPSSDFLNVELRRDRRVATALPGSAAVRMVNLDTDGPRALELTDPSVRALICGVYTFDDVLFLEGSFSDEIRGSSALLSRTDSYAPFVVRSRRLREMLGAARSSGLFTSSSALAPMDWPSYSLDRLPSLPSALSPPPEPIHSPYEDDGGILERAVKPRAGRALFGPVEQLTVSTRIEQMLDEGGAAAMDDPREGGGGFLALPQRFDSSDAGSIRRSTSTPAYMSKLAAGRAPFREVSRKNTPQVSPIGSPHGSSAQLSFPPVMASASGATFAAGGTQSVPATPAKP